MATETTKTGDQPQDSPAASPDFLAPPKRGKDVRRLNNRPLFVVGAIVFVAVIAVGYTYNARQVEMRENATGPNPPVRQAAQPPVLSQPPVSPPPQQTPPATAAPVTTTETAPPPAQQQIAPIGQVAQPAQPSEAYLERMRQIRAIEEKRLAQFEAALDAGIVVEVPQRTPEQPTPNIDPSQPNAAELIARYAAAGGNGQLPNGLPPQLPNTIGGGVVPGGDPNGQAAKRAFLSQSNQGSNYLQQRREAALAPTQEVKAGTIIPGVMISGLNSDLPGQIIAQVSENVYDTVSGENLLIPAGARLIGTYDNSVTNGQSRALVGWTRLLFPDGSSINLELMPGTDQSGYAGFNDKVNRHYGRVIGNALLLSVFSAGVQLSQPQQNSGDGFTSQQIIAAEIGRQLGQLGIETARRGLDVQPTLEIRPGYRFNVMITKDIILPKWLGHPLASQ